jgi:hypothetical protein
VSAVKYNRPLQAMILLLITSWNVTMAIGAIIALGGVYIGFMFVGFCFLRMVLILRSKGKISKSSIIFPCSIYIRFNKLVKSGSKDFQPYRWYIPLLKKMLIIIPLCIIIGLLIMTIGKSL